MKHIKQSKFTKETLRRTLVMGILVSTIGIGSFMIYCISPVCKSETDTDRNDEVITETTSSHMGSASVVKAATVNEPTNLVQFVEASKFNPHSGKLEVDYSIKGTPLYVPEGIGACHTFMAWQMITDPTTKQYQLRMQVESYDENDFGKVGWRYAVAVKPYYGKIGDYIDVIQEDDSVINCIIVEYKGDENKYIDGEMSKYYHTNKDVVEFVVNQYAWYTDQERTVYDYHPEWNQNIKSIYNVGNYWGE